MEIETLLQQYGIYLAAALIWSMVLKGVALWKAARNNSKAWFIAIFLINSLGLLELFYIFVFSRNKKEKIESIA